MDINRGAIVVKPKQPYVEWANSCDEFPTKTTVAEARNDCHAYLVPCWDDDKEFERILRKVCRFIFDNELSGWSTDESIWPKRRGFYRRVIQVIMTRARMRRQNGGKAGGESDTGPRFLDAQTREAQTLAP